MRAIIATTDTAVIWSAVQLSYKMSSDEFVNSCRCGKLSEAKSMVERDPGLLNKQRSDGSTGLMCALDNGNHSLCRWLLSLPGLDTNISDNNWKKALHYASMRNAPLDIVITLIRLSSPETVKSWGNDNDVNVLKSLVKRDSVTLDRQTLLQVPKMFNPEATVSKVIEKMNKKINPLHTLFTVQQYTDDEVICKDS